MDGLAFDGSTTYLFASFSGCVGRQHVGLNRICFEQLEDKQTPARQTNKENSGCSIIYIFRYLIDVLWNFSCAHVSTGWCSSSDKSTLTVNRKNNLAFHPIVNKHQFITTTGIHKYHDSDNTAPTTTTSNQRAQCCCSSTSFGFIVRNNKQ